MGTDLPDESTKRSILVVEDDEVLARLYRTVLSHRGWEVFTAATEPEAVECFSAHRTPVVLTDYRLPKGDGISLIKEVKRVSPRTEVVLISGYLMPELVDKATNNGVFECLRKPAELAKILQTVENAFSRAIENGAAKGSHDQDDWLRHVQSAVDSTAHYAAAIDTNYTIVVGNTFFKDRFGAEAIGRKCYDVFALLGKLCPGCRAVAALESGKKRALTHPVRLLEGNPTVLEEHIEPFQAQEGLKHLILTFSEVEVVPKAASARGGFSLADPNDFVPAGARQESFVLVTTLEGKILFSNEPFRHTFLREGEAPHKTVFFDYCDSYFVGNMREMGYDFRKWVAEHNTLETWCESTQGERISVCWEFSIAAWPGCDGAVVMCIGNNAERLRPAQHWSQFYDACYREIFRYQFGMVLVCDSDRRIIAANDRLLRALGARSRDVVGRLLNEFLAFDEDTTQIEEHSQKLKIRGATDDFRIRIRCPNGTVLSALASLVAINNAYNVTEGYALVLQDVEEQEKFERMLNHIEKMYNLGGLSAGIAHQMNNCLCAIISWAEMMKCSPQKAPSPDTIIDTATRMQQLSTEILQLARKPQGLANDPFHLSHTIDTLTSLTARRMKQDGIVFHTEMTPDIPILYSSEAKLEHVLLNLLTNAVEAIRQHPALVTRNITMSTVRSDEAIFVDVSDTGPGIPPEIQEKVFDRFFTTKQSGTGLGLALSSSIMNSIGGDVRLLRTGPEGTVFRVSIPLTLAHRTQEKDKPC